MLIKLGHIGVINVTAISKLIIKEVAEKEIDRNSYSFIPNVKFNLHFQYEDLNGNLAEEIIDCGPNHEFAGAIMKEILQQAFEVEMEQGTVVLENALKENNNG